MEPYDFCEFNNGFLYYFLCSYVLMLNNILLCIFVKYHLMSLLICVMARMRFLEKSCNFCVLNDFLQDFEALVMCLCVYKHVSLCLNKETLVFPYVKPTALTDLWKGSCDLIDIYGCIYVLLIVHEVYA